MNTTPNTTPRPHDHPSAARLAHLVARPRRSLAATGAGLAILALGIPAVGLGSGVSRADADAGPQRGDFPPLSLSYSDAQGPGQATIAPPGPDAATEGIAVTLSIAQAGGTLSGPGFVRQVDSHTYVVASAVTGVMGQSGVAGDTYFLAGTLVRGDGGQVWRGRGRWSSAGNPSLAGEWHMAEWPAIEPPSSPHLTTSVRLDPPGGAGAGAGAGGDVTLVALPEGETRFELQLTGLIPGADYTINLYAGTPAQPSASFTRLATVTADTGGRANTNGLVRFRGTEAIPLLDIADGSHFIAVTGPGGTVAAGAIPALQPLG